MFCQRLSLFDLVRKDVCKNYTFFHRNLSSFEKLLDSNERELLGCSELIFGSVNMLKGKSLTLHFDNENAAKVLSKGSSKIRLHQYALKVSKFLQKVV